MKLIKLFFILIFANGMAQTNYIPGKITTNDHQVIEGEINYQDWKRTPEVISFRNGNTETNYKPEDLIAFEVENDKYVSREVKLDVTEQRLREMNNTDEAKFENRHIFLHILALGNANLYEYYDNRIHFFAEKENQFMELISRKVLDKNNNNDLRIFNKYIGQINVLFSDCKTISAINGVEYKRKSMIKIFNEYNICKGNINESVYVKEQEKKKNRFYVTVGYYFSNFSLDGKAQELKLFDGGALSSPSIGIAYEINLSKNLGKWVFYPELVYKKYSKEFQNDIKSSDYVLYNPLNFKFSSIDLSLLFRYNFIKSNRKVVPFINAGVGLSNIISKEFSVTRTNTFNNSIEDIELEANSNHFTVSLGAGVTYNKFIFELRYIASDKVLNLYDSNSLSSIGLLVSYQVF